MTLWIPLGIILLCGAVGGIINAIISDNGFVKPREETIDNVCILRPGIAGNICWGLRQLLSPGGFMVPIVAFSFLEIRK